MNVSVMAHVETDAEFSCGREEDGKIRLDFQCVGQTLHVWLHPDLAERVQHAILDQLVPFD